MSLPDVARVGDVTVDSRDEEIPAGGHHAVI